MGRAAEAEEAVGVRVGVEVERLDAGNAGGFEAMRDIGFEGKMRLAGRSVGEEAVVFRRLFEEGSEQLSKR